MSNARPKGTINYELAQCVIDASREGWTGLASDYELTDRDIAACVDGLADAIDDFARDEVATLANDRTLAVTLEDLAADDAPSDHLDNNAIIDRLNDEEPLFIDGDDLIPSIRRALEVAMGARVNDLLDGTVDDDAREQRRGNRR